MASFGEKLRQQRELRGIALRDISEATKISVRFLQALETDRVDILPGGIFRRSFVREYARFVGLDPERMVSEFLHAHGDPAAPTEGRTAIDPAAPSRNGFYRRFFLGVAVAGLCGGGAWAVTRQAPETASAPLPAAPPMLFPEDRLLPHQEPAALASAPLVLTLTAREECWVALHDGGRLLLEKVLRPGESETVQAGGDEVRLDVGDAGALDLVINDRPASPLGERGEVRKNIVIKKDGFSTPPADAPSPRHAAAQSG